jgi:glutamate-ammonia-ligase adenylyltransferase
MQPWERLALVRSRILAGSAEVRARWADALQEVVFEFHWDEESVSAIRHLKRRIEGESNKESRICLDFKYGTGGISDLDFLVQLLQVFHGKAHPAVRVPGVADALPALREVGVLSSQEASFLLTALQFQRRVENHYQLIEEWTSREISRESPALERLARSLGYRRGSPGEARKSLLADWDRTARLVRAMVNKYFYGIR